MDGEFHMNLRGVGLTGLLTLVLCSFSYGQSLGDIARQTRAEQQRKGAPHTKVITNDDIPNSSTALAASSRPESENEADRSNTDMPGEKASEGAERKDVKTDPAKELEAKEIEAKKRTQEINKQYLDRIADLRARINAARSELARIQVDQAESTVDFRRTVNTQPNPAEYAKEQAVFNEQIGVQRDLIESLNSQLEDAIEAARHAGVPHVTD